MVPSAYNNNMQLVQTRDHVVILNEMIHSARIVALNGRPHPPASIRSLTGDSIGHWEGDTLVVDTTNFSQDAGFSGREPGTCIWSSGSRASTPTRCATSSPSTIRRPGRRNGARRSR